MSQEFLEISAGVPLIPGLFRSGFFLYLNTALFAFRPVVLETVVTVVYVGLAVPIARRLWFRLHLLVMLVSIIR